VNAPAIRLF